MFNFVYYPVSWLMKLWYTLFSFVFGQKSSIPWILSIIFLVLTVRLVMYIPSKKQMETQRLMQKHSAAFKEIKKKYAKDFQARGVAEQKLRKDIGLSNPLSGCLPQLVQLGAFFGLYHVLRSFNHMASSSSFGIGGTSSDITAQMARNMPNYAFNVQEVRNFLDARAFGIPLSSYITQPVDQFKAFMPNPNDVINFNHLKIAIVLIPLMIISATATHLNSRFSIKRNLNADIIPQNGIMNFVMLWVFPLGTLATGFIMPGCLLLYFMTNNVCTFLQTHLVHSHLDRIEDKKSKLSEESVAKLTPKPGTKPVKVQTKTVDEKPLVDEKTTKVITEKPIDNSPKPGARPTKPNRTNNTKRKKK